MLKPLFSAVVLSFACVCTNAQNNLPSAPAPAAPAASKPDFSMPATVPHTAVYPPPSDTPVPAVAKDTFCTAPSDGGMRTRQNLTPQQRGELKDFISAFSQRVFTQWMRGMPRAANDPWLRTAFVLVRFDILTNGSLRDPVVMMSSGRGSYDDHAIRTLIAAQPYPLPEDFTEPLHGCYRFGYNYRSDDLFKPDALTPKSQKANP